MPERAAEVRHRERAPEERLGLGDAARFGETGAEVGERFHGVAVEREHVAPDAASRRTTSRDTTGVKVTGP